jgi:PhnB protein
LEFVLRSVVGNAESATSLQQVYPSKESPMSAATVPSAPDYSAMPEVRGGITPYLQISSASDASAFYQKAFGALEVFRVPVDEQGRTMHIHLYVNGGSLMLSDAYPEYGHPQQTPEAFSLNVQVDDIDAWWERAVSAGAEVVMPISEMFWGARYGQVRDPFGVIWAFNQPLKN